MKLLLSYIHETVIIFWKLLIVILSCHENINTTTLWLFNIAMEAMAHL